MDERSLGDVVGVAKVHEIEVACICCKLAYTGVLLVCRKVVKLQKVLHLIVKTDFFEEKFKFF